MWFRITSTSIHSLKTCNNHNKMVVLKDPAMINESPGRYNDYVSL